ncbi:ABC transporter substrate-binding protein [Zhihengliuella sp.]|uniref:ABC transporter substrate-binding protein n=1 Tax=Zhihengliuella sp. TaxID=1954483 RepID=UPI0028110AFC|nr:ABC transporter substrate-binding protein [Zhihengliuella sp.]
MAITRRAGLLAAAAAVVLTASACSGSAAPAESADSPEGAGGFPVTVEHIYGETVIKEQPERVAAVSWVNADTALALGVVPVAMPEDTWGGNENGSTDWKDAKLEELGAAIGTENAPVQYSEADGINYEAIAESTPDVILAGYSGLTQEEYDKLSKIAPVVGPQKENYLASWQSVTEATGAALGKTEEAEQVVADVEAQFAAVVEENPVLEESTFIAGNVDAAANTLSIYAGDDTRPRFFKALGMEQAPVVDELVEDGQFYGDVSPERSSELESDVFYSWVAGEEGAEAVRNHDLFKQIPGVANGGFITTVDDHSTLAISSASALSLPWAIENIVPDVVAAAEAAAE